LRGFIQSVELAGKIPQQISLQGKYSAILLPLGYRLLGDINQITSIMPAALVGTILLTLRGRGVGRNELIRKVKWLKDEIIMRGGKVAESGRSSTEVLVDRAVGVLRDLVGKRFDILESVYYPLRRFELSYYRNQVIHLFVPECIVSVAMYATIKVGGPIRNQRIAVKTRLFQDAKFLSMLLRDEFVYERGGINHNLDKTLDRLVSANVVVVGKDQQNGGELWVTLSAEERRTGRETFGMCFRWKDSTQILTTLHRFLLLFTLAIY
jgi:glycerol-3-phosphate O-acyltransferase